MMITAIYKESLITYKKGKRIHKVYVPGNTLPWLFLGCAVAFLLELKSKLFHLIRRSK